MSMLEPSDNLAASYNVRAAVPDHLNWFEEYARLSRQAIERHRPLTDLRYGPNPKETLDLFVPSSKARGTFLFIHGGYWRSMDKAEHLFVAEPFLAQGYAVAVINYDLCPEVTIATIVDECRRAITWLVHEGGRYGAAPAPLIVGGHSAGAHLTAMMVATPAELFDLKEHPVSGALALSGLYDLCPLVQLAAAADLQLDEATAARLSPAQFTPSIADAVFIAVGGDETSAFIQQSRLLWECWSENRLPVKPGPLLIPEKHHFNVLLDLVDSASLLTRSTLRLFERG